MSYPYKLTHGERRELARLHRRWAWRTATRAEIMRCMELERRERLHITQVDAAAERYRAASRGS